MKLIAALTLLGITTLSNGTTGQTSNNAPPTAKGTISIQEMLISGPPQLKMHSLAMLTQGKVKGEIDESYLPGFMICADNASAPIRSITAQLLGKYFVADQEQPNPEAVTILNKLAQDGSADVRYTAVYYGLSQVKNQTPETAELLIDIAAENRQETLQDRIIVSLANYRPQVTEILDRKLKEDNAIAYFEIYENFTGKPPVNAEKYLDMPSSRIRMFIFSAAGNNSDSARAELNKALKALGIENPSVQISGIGSNYALTLKTYITKEGIAVEKNFSGEGKFQITQQMWLSPELEIQFEAMQKARNSQ